jgi:hypothetical protein
MQVPIQAWFFVTDFPSKETRVQTTIVNDNGMAFLNEIVINLNSGLAKDHPFGAFKPGLRAEIRRAVQNQNFATKHSDIFSTHS